MQTEIMLQSFAETVQRMREAQKSWFRYHSKKDLRESIQLEKLIDDQIKLILDGKPIISQQNLFS